MEFVKLDRAGRSLCLAGLIFFLASTGLGLFLGRTNQNTENPSPANLLSPVGQSPLQLAEQEVDSDPSQIRVLSLHALMWVAFALGSFLTLFGLRLWTRPEVSSRVDDPRNSRIVRIWLRFVSVLEERKWPSVRLRTVMVSVVIVSVGLTLEVERRRRVERQRLALIADGRRALAIVHQSAAEQLRKQLTENREWVKKQQRRMSADPIPFSSNNYREDLYKDRLAIENPFLEARASWEDLMASRAAWAAAHPAEPWPPRPAEPLPPQEVPIRGTSTSTNYPFQLVAPAAPQVPNVVKKNH